jgi:hypothetical protein
MALSHGLSVPGPEQPEDGSVYVIEYFGGPARRRGEFLAIVLSLRDEVGSDEAPRSLSGCGESLPAAL